MIEDKRRHFDPKGQSPSSIKTKGTNALGDKPSQSLSHDDLYICSSYNFRVLNGPLVPKSVHAQRYEESIHTTAPYRMTVELGLMALR